MAINVILLAGLVLSALATVMTARVMRSAITLALTSAILAMLMFRLNSPLAAVFELSVCAGLIPAIFLSVIGLTRRLTPEALAVRKKEKLKRYWALPVIVLLAAMALLQVQIPLDFVPPAPVAEQDVRNVLWNLRHADLLGQIVVLVAGALGVVVLVKGARRE
jgi:NADH-quinone oxidoreductase subunit J